MKEKEMYQLTYNAASDRIEYNEYGLHCGDGLEVLTADGWKSTRIEYSWDTKSWYLVGLPGIAPAGLFARR